MAFHIYYTVNSVHPITSHYEAQSVQIAFGGCWRYPGLTEPLPFIREHSFPSHLRTANLGIAGRGRGERTKHGRLVRKAGTSPME